MASTVKLKRGPTVLVSDSPEPRQRALQRPGIMSQRSKISVDNILQYASEIPSGQRRGPPQNRPNQFRSPNARHPSDPKLSGRMAQQHIPVRSSKVSEKLVLLPEADVGDDDDDDEKDIDQGPPRDEGAGLKRVPTGLKNKTLAESLPKSARQEKLSRVTAYCTAQAYKMRATTDFVRSKHGAKTKLYDDCLYTVYHLPLLPGIDGYRIQSSPVLKSPGGKAILDEEIERNERHEYREGFFGEERYGVRGADDNEDRRRESSQLDGDLSAVSDHQDENEGGAESNNQNEQHNNYQLTPPAEFPPTVSGQRRPSSPNSLQAHLASSLMTFAEMFIFSYGVVVFWNFTERQEKDILADLTFSSSTSSITHSLNPLAVRPQLEEDFETEEFHFEYNPEISRPRLFNDMITLRTGDHMIKLAMSHAIAQSTKLSFFEERMADTMGEAQYVPRRLALRGELGMKREDIVRILGRLFVSRVDVNLSSNMLDVPNFFWDSEPTLHPLYAAVREYLEIKPRIQVLNERCRVFLDLAEILSDSIADRKVSRQTWIIIILIVISILVTTFEVFLRFVLVSKRPHPLIVPSLNATGVQTWNIATPSFGRFVGISDDL